MNQHAASLKVLVAPLDWGLGHATRCVPIIRQLLNDRAEVILAASGKGKRLLQQEFPQLRMLHLPGYEIEYASSTFAMPFKIVAQIPKLLSAIKKERDWLKKLMAKERIDLVISDNRYGLHHPGARSVFITHQLRIKTPFKLIEDALQKVNYKYINRFNECWVPDAEGQQNLAGELSHPSVKPKVPLKYIGPISRFKSKRVIANGEYIMIIISGPEPQRSLLEKLIVEELKDYKKPAILVRGLPQVNAKPLSVEENVTVYDHLPANELEQKIKGAAFIISRCGYSTVMDLAALKKRSILIPTPGQTEQGYLAKHLMKMNFAFCIQQKKFRLRQALYLASNFPYEACEAGPQNLEETISKLVNMQMQKEIFTP